MYIKSILFASLLLTPLVKASESTVNIDKNDAPSSALEVSIETPKETESIPVPDIDQVALPDTPPGLLQLKEPIGEKPTKYSYVYDHHEQLSPELIQKIINKGYQALKAIHDGTIDRFDHQLDCFAGDLYKYNDRWFGTGLHWGFGKEWILKTIYYSKEQSQLLDEFHKKRTAQLETFICVIWALTDHAFEIKEGFKRGSFSIIDPEQRLYRYLEKFACFSASFPELPKPSAPINTLENLSNVSPNVHPSLSSSQPPSDSSPLTAEEEKDLTSLDQENHPEEEKDPKSLDQENHEECTEEDTKDSPSHKTPQEALVLTPSAIEDKEKDDDGPPSDNEKDDLTISSETISTTSEEDSSSKLKLISPDVEKLPYAVFNIWGSNFAYQRSSSHYVQLSNTQIGIDIRFESSSFALALLPFRMTHILFASVKTQGKKQKTFVKFEEAGLGDVRSIASHLSYYSAPTTGLNTQVSVRREKDIIPIIANGAESLIVKLHEINADLESQSWIYDIVKDYLYRSKPKTYFEDSAKVDIFQLYKLSKKFSNYTQNQEISELAKALKKSILDHYNKKTLKYRTGNEVVLHLGAFKEDE
ncbi:MAG TPA: hypothetical protein VNJ29_00095 [Candidatus Nitrosotenuis sp.]|jgi:hypothetical protein|nr:hypothetical protein [Candidatus Nitrosotenuis sp.]